MGYITDSQVVHDGKFFRVHFGSGKSYGNCRRPMGIHFKFPSWGIQHWKCVIGAVIIGFSPTKLGNMGYSIMFTRYFNKISAQRK